MKPKRTSTTIKGNTEIIDWRAVHFFNRLRMGLGIIIYGKLEINWKSTKINIIDNNE